MIYIENESLNPYFNLACDEYCLTQLDLNEDIVMLWRDDNAIIVGKNQNTFEEINAEYVKQQNIKVCRRVTGGGAVYHDLGNLCFTFILNIEKLDQMDMRFFALPVVKALEKMGVTAEISGRNDITIDGRKFSGTAQRVYKNRLLYHGTLLFDSNMEVLSKGLNVKPNKIESKGHKSVRSRVTNIKEYIKEDIDILQFKSILKEKLFEGQEYKEYVLTNQDIENIKKMETEKFATWDWNYGQSPESNFKNAVRFDGGEVDLRLMIKDGFIENAKFYGDFLAVEYLDDLEDALKGQKYDIDTVDKILDKVNLKQYFGTITKQEILSCMFP